MVDQESKPYKDECKAELRKDWQDGASDITATFEISTTVGGVTTTEFKTVPAKDLAFSSFPPVFDGKDTIYKSKEVSAGSECRYCGCCRSC